MAISGHVQGDAAAGVDDAGDGGNRARVVLEQREKEEQDTRAGVESGKEDPLPLFIRDRINGMHENQGDQKMMIWLCGRLDFWEIH